MTTPRTILPILFVAMLYLLPPSLSAQNAGAVIFVDIQGEVKVQNLKSKAFLDAGEVAVGKSIIEGHAVESSGDGKVILLFFCWVRSGMIAWGLGLKPRLGLGD